MNVIRTDEERVERYCNEHVYNVNKRVSISEKTGDLNHRPKQLRPEIMNYTLPRHRRKNNRRKYNNNDNEREFIQRVVINKSRTR